MSRLPSATLTPTPSPSPTTTTTPTLQATSTSTPRAEIDFGNQQVLAFPNPAKDRVRFAWKAAQADFVKINIYSLTGERIAELSATPAGENTLAWSTSGIAPGVYMYQVVLTVQGREERQGIRKLAIVK
ncbi:MAG: T9SS type A sorting domain-containing protein [Candidatus Firestonebacteria bacterium]|nr:T9SS type A sorting domain-containing protein [Candidatus Firestonebacteria bacterium]